MTRGKPTQADYAAAIHAAIASAKRGDKREALAQMFAARVLAPHIEPEPCRRCGNLYDHRYPCVG